MATIHVFRHAESMHNIVESFRRRRDPPLSVKGVEQCQAFQEQCPWMDKVIHVISSPLRRALDTSLLTFAPALKDRPVLVLPHIAEVGAQPSGFGSTRQELIERFRDEIDVTSLPDDFGNLDPEGPQAYDVKKVSDRILEARMLLTDAAIKAGEGYHIVVVSHGQACHFLTDNYEGVKPPRWEARWDGNLTYRSYTVDVYSSTGEWMETPESLERRGVARYAMDKITKDEIKTALAEKIAGRKQRMEKLYAEYRVKALLERYTRKT